MNKKLPVIDKIWDYKNPVATEQKFTELLPVAKEYDFSYYLEVLTQIARTQGLQHKFNEALNTLSKVEKVLTKELVLPKIRFYLEKGRVYNSSNQQVLAVKEFEAALDLAVQAKQDFFAIDAAHMLGIADKKENLLKWNLQALDMTEKSTDLKAMNWKGSLYNNIGWTYHEHNDYPAALSYFEKALTYWEGKSNHQRTFISKWTIARCYRSLEQNQKALGIQHQLLTEIEEGDVESDGFVYEELGECYRALGESKLATSFFITAYKLLSQDKWLQANESARLERLRKLGGG